MHELTLQVGDHETRHIALRHGLVAGWTARDENKVREHIEELREIGVAPPSTVPVYYRVAASLFTTGRLIQTVGLTGSGEIEPVLIDDGEDLCLGLGSDHTDRELESHSVALSKQIAAKPLASRVWRFREVADHCDRITLQSRISEDGRDWVAYQSGTLAAIRPLLDLASHSPAAAANGRLQAGTIMMGGTLPVLEGGVRPSRYFAMTMHDPVLGRSITHTYETEGLPLAE